MLYASLTTLSTVGFGDVVATQPWIRMAAPVQALTGFALLRAGLTWFTQVHPPLSRRRALALALRDSAHHSKVPELPAGAPRLSAALDRLGSVLAEDFVSGDDAETIFATYADDHRRR
ncbi:MULTISPECIES: potassium channel family protein [Citricoccus]|uniref:potassium channel family protein n=1 Tax=Citricoccus TaxID=169133 RepID=UPI000255F0B4|nr:potassium channel family protein [Citricoccus sp. CH26A]